MMPGSLRMRLTLLHAGLFLVMAVAVLAVPLLSVSETTEVGSSAPPGRPSRARFPAHGNQWSADHLAGRRPARSPT